VEARRQHQGVLSARGALLVAIATATVWLSATPADAHNEWKGGYRKWPWRAGTGITLSTLPGECPHCPGVQSSSAWKAIDATMKYETVYSIGPGRIDRWEPSGGKAGKYLRILGDDGLYITYEHLSQALVTSGRVVAGQPIAASGCSGNCSGPHLHFQRHDGPSFSSKARALVEISGHGAPASDPLAHTAYTSDNAGIGYNAGGGVSSKMQAVYAAQGGYDSIGITADVGDAWSPCRKDSIYGTWYRYYCAGSSEWKGGVQTFYAASQRPKAIMQRGSNVHVLHTGLLAAYTERMNDSDWVYIIGYPTSNPIFTQSGYKQTFDEGIAWVYPANCIEDLYANDGRHRRYYFCD